MESISGSEITKKEKSSVCFANFSVERGLNEGEKILSYVYKCLVQERGTYKERVSLYVSLNYEKNETQK